MQDLDNAMHSDRKTSTFKVEGQQLQVQPRQSGLPAPGISTGSLPCSLQIPARPPGRAGRLRLDLDDGKCLQEMDREGEEAGCPFSQPSPCPVLGRHLAHFPEILRED